MGILKNKKSRQQQQQGPKKQSGKSKEESQDTKGLLKNKKNKINEKQLKEEVEKRKKYIEEEEEVYSDIEESGVLGGVETGVSLEEQKLLEQFMMVGGMNVEKTVEEGLQQRDEQLKRANRLKDPRVVTVYTDVAKLMKEFTNGQLSKPFKALPFISEWKALLDLTKPTEWSTQAMERATRYLIANLDSYRAQIFLQDYLLPAVRKSIANNKRLDIHLFIALKRSVYKPTAFFKGLVFGLLSDKPLLKECQILGSVIQKVSIPVVYSSVALLKLCEMPRGVTWLFIKVILEKQYTLPMRVVTRLHQYFVSFQSHCDPLFPVLPVLWHQMLLSFAIHYSQSLEDIQIQGFKQLIKSHKHHQITQQIILALNGEYKEVERLKTHKTNQMQQFDDNDMIVE